MIPKENAEVVEHADLTEHESQLVEISTLAEMVQSAVGPFAEAQKVVAVEATKQTEIIVLAKTKMFWGICGIVAGIIILAGMALFLEKEQITEKIIIAIVSFLGGLGFGRQSGKEA